MKQNTTIIVLVVVMVVILVIRYFINRKKPTDTSADLLSVHGELTPPLTDVPVTSRG